MLLLVDVCGSSGGLCLRYEGKKVTEMWIVVIKMEKGENGPAWYYYLVSRILYQK